MKSIMIDLETFSTKPDAAIVSIGAVIFDENEVLESYYAALFPAHGHIDPKTVMWWMKQNDAARHVITNSEPEDDEAAAIRLYDFVLAGGHNIQEVWANDPNFDCTILENWWVRIKPQRMTTEWLQYPFNFRHYRSFRTLRSLSKDMDVEVARVDPGVAHNALSDATAQARYVINQKKNFHLNLSRAATPTDAEKQA